MKKKLRPKPSRSTAKPQEPLAEGIRKTKRGRDWASMSDEEIVRFAQSFMEEKEISRRGELSKADEGLYAVLRNRGVLDSVDFEDEYRDWASMSDEELISYSSSSLREKGIVGRKELAKVDSGLYTVLRIRGLLDSVGFEEKRKPQRDWASMDDEKLVRFAQSFMEEKEIGRRVELKKTDLGLYDTLRRRRLLDAVFAPLESEKREEAIQEVVDAMAEFDSS